jgi:hypothetical protein
MNELQPMTDEEREAFDIEHGATSLPEMVVIVREKAEMVAKAETPILKCCSNGAMEPL